MLEEPALHRRTIIELTHDDRIALIAEIRTKRETIETRIRAAKQVRDQLNVGTPVRKQLDKLLATIDKQFEKWDQLTAKLEGLISEVLGE